MSYPNREGLGLPAQPHTRSGILRRGNIVNTLSIQIDSPPLRRDTRNTSRQVHQTNTRDDHTLGANLDSHVASSLRSFTYVSQAADGL